MLNENYFKYTLLCDMIYLWAIDTKLHILNINNSLDAGRVNLLPCHLKKKVLMGEKKQPVSYYSFHYSLIKYFIPFFCFVILHSKNRQYIIVQIYL